jgi:transposase
MDGTVGDGSWLRTTGVGRGDAVCRRRRWSAACKAAIVAESFVAGTKVSEIAVARHGLQANLLSTWRRQAKPAAQRYRVRRAAVEPPAVTMDFVPVTVSTEVAGLRVRRLTFDRCRTCSHRAFPHRA